MPYTNATNSVLVSVGDGRLTSTYTLIVEGVSYWPARVSGSNQFMSTINNITAADGRLALSRGSAGELAARIDFVEVSTLSSPMLAYPPASPCRCRGQRGKRALCFFV